MGLLSLSISSFCHFGYLRRNPNDRPDADYCGYDFWLTKRNEFHGNFVNAEMVKAFIVSGEYRIALAYTHRFLRFWLRQI